MAVGSTGVVNMCSSGFSVDGKYYSQLNSDGKLKIWDTETNVLKQEYTPNLHLNSPLTCLHWVQLKPKSNKSCTPKRKRVGASYIIVLGTSKGMLQLYSLAEAKIIGSLGKDQKGHKSKVNCISWERNNLLYSCSNDGTIVEWDMNTNTSVNNFKVGNEAPQVIQVVSKLECILSASSSIQLWSLKNKRLIKTFIGHSSQISLLKVVEIRKNNKDEVYCMSGSNNDLILNVWNISAQKKDTDIDTDGETAVAVFRMEDIPHNVSTTVIEDQVCVTVATRSGVVHYYKHMLNGKIGKPLKPNLTLQVVSDDSASKSQVQPISIAASFLFSDTCILIGHGNEIQLVFEKIEPEPNEKIQVLIRQGFKKIDLKKASENLQKTKTPEIDNDKVEYIGPSNSINLAIKRNASKKVELPMQSRLENLSLVTDTQSKAAVPQGNNYTQLLIQGLNSKDKTILKTVLERRNEEVIANTISRLPIQYIVPLLKELTTYIQGKIFAAQIGTIWMRVLLQTHAGHLMSIGTENLVEIISPCLGIIENRLNLLQPISRLQGRLDLLVNQISVNRDTDTNDLQDPHLMVYQDEDSNSSSSENEIPVLTSDDDWDEQSVEEIEEESDAMLLENNIDSDDTMSN